MIKDLKVNDISIFKTTIHLEIKAWFNNRRMPKAVKTSI